MRSRTFLRHPRLWWVVWLFLVVFASSLRCDSQITLSFPEEHQVVVLHVPGRSPALQIDVLHLNILDNSLSQDLTARRLRAEDSRGWILSAFVTLNRDRRLDAKGFREYVWQELQKAPFQRSEMKTYERGEVAIRQYMVERFQGRPIHSMNVFAYLVSSDLWLDVHISKTDFSPQDQALLNRFLDGIKAIASYEPNSKEQFGYGSIFYLMKDWDRAAQHYEAALTLEKRQRALPRDEWRVLVDNLGMAYGLSGKIPKAQAVLEYGVSQEPTYPMFHYNLACAHAEMGEVDAALKELETAFRYKANSISGEGMPDPRQDDSFKGLLTNERFRALSKSVCPASRKTNLGYMCQP